MLRILAAGQAFNHRVRVRFGEEWHRVTVHTQRADHPMWRGQVTVVAPARHHVAEIDHERAVDRRCVDPLALDVAHLQPAGGILIQQGDAAVIGVCAGALLLLGTGGVAGRIVDHSQYADGLIEAGVEEVGLDVQRQGHGPQQGLGERLHVEVMLLQQRFPAGYRGVTVRAAQGFFCQYVRVVIWQVQAHVEGFFEVAGSAWIELLGGDGAVAAVVAGLGDVDLQFFGSGEGEELFGAIEHGFYSRWADRVALDVEKTPFAAGVVDLAGDGLPGGLIVGVERGDVDDGKLIHAQSLRTLKIQCGSEPACVRQH